MSSNSSNSTRQGVSSLVSKNGKVVNIDRKKQAIAERKARREQREALNKDVALKLEAQRDELKIKSTQEFPFLTAQLEYVKHRQNGENVSKVVITKDSITVHSKQQQFRDMSKEIDITFAQKEEIPNPSYHQKVHIINPHKVPTGNYFQSKYRIATGKHGDKLEVKTNKQKVNFNLPSKVVKIPIRPTIDEKVSEITSTVKVLSIRNDLLTEMIIGPYSFKLKIEEVVENQYTVWFENDKLTSMMDVDASDGDINDQIELNLVREILYKDNGFHYNMIPYFNNKHNTKFMQPKVQDITSTIISAIGYLSYSRSFRFYNTLCKLQVEEQCNFHEVALEMDFFEEDHGVECTGKLTTISAENWDIVCGNIDLVYEAKEVCISEHLNLTTPCLFKLMTCDSQKSLYEPICTPTVNTYEQYVSVRSRFFTMPVMLDIYYIKNDWQAMWILQRIDLHNEQPIVACATPLLVPLRTSMDGFMRDKSSANYLDLAGQVEKSRVYVDTPFRLPNQKAFVKHGLVKFQGSTYSRVTTTCENVEHTASQARSVIDNLAQVLETIKQYAHQIKQQVGEKVHDFIEFFYDLMKSFDAKVLLAQCVVIVVPNLNINFKKACLDLLVLLGGELIKNVNNLVVKLDDTKKQAYEESERSKLLERITYLELLNMDVKRENEKLRNYIRKNCPPSVPGDKGISVDIIDHVLKHQMLDNNVFVTLLSSLFKIDYFKYVKFFSSFNVMYNFFNNVSKLSITDFISYIPNFIKDIIVYFFPEAFMYLDQDFKELSLEYARIGKIITQSESAINNIPLQTIVDLHQLCEKVKITFVEHPKMLAKHKITFNVIERDVKSWYAMKKNVTTKWIPRKAPFGILLCGESGVGKSTLASTLASVIHDHAQELDIKSGPTAMYSYNADLDFMDGYAQQTCMIIDELGSSADGKDLSALFSMISNNPYVVPMASLEDKGTMFTSEVVIACTNLTSFDCFSAAYLNTEALDRRFPLVIDCILPLGSTKEADFSNHVFSVTNFVNGNKVMCRYGNVVKETFTLNELINYILYSPLGIGEHVHKQNFLDSARTFSVGTISRDAFKFQGLLTNAALLGSYSYLFRSAFFELIRRFAPQGGAGLFVALDAAIIGLLSGAMIGSAINIMGEKKALEKENDMLWIQNTELETELKQLRTMQACIQDFKRSGISNTIGQLINTAVEQSLASKSLASFKVLRKPAVTQSFENDLEKNLVLQSVERLIDVAPREVMNDLVQLKTCMERVHVKNQMYKPHNKVDADLFEQCVEHPVKYYGQSFDQNANDLAFKMSKYLFVGEIHDMNKVVVAHLCGTPLYDSFVLFPKHFTDKLNQQMLLTITNSFATRTFTFNQYKVLKFSEQVDAAIIDFGHHMPFLPNFLKYFIRENELSNIPVNVSATIPSNNLPNFTMMYSVVASLVTNAQFQMENGNSVDLVRGFSYQVNTISGDCGSPLIATETSLAHKILGIHILASVTNHYAYSVLITCEMINNLIGSGKGLEPQIIRSQDLIAFERSNYHVSVNRKTALRNYNVLGLPIYKRPGDLSVKWIDGKRVDPLEVGVFKYAGSDAFFDPVILENCADFLVYKAEKLPYNRERRVLGISEAINTYGNMDKINMASSPGYPYVLQGPKSKFISMDNNGILTVRFDYKEDLTEDIWICSLKDETIKPGKAPRVFEIAPLHYTIMVRRYFGSFIDFVHTHPMEIFSCVGINPESTQWHILMQKLLKVSDVGMAADWSKFDGTLPWIVMYYVCDFVNKWYNDEHGNVRFHLLRSAVFRRSLVNGVLYTANHGLPSGFPLTAIFNSFSNVILYMFFFMSKCPISFRNLNYFDSLTSLFVYGDDSVCAISPKIIEWFNMTEMSKFYLERHMKVTMDQKDAELEPIISCLNFTFLKRSFRLDHRGFYVPQISIATIISMLTFIRESKYSTLEESLLVNMEVACRFLYFFGEFIYEDFVKRFRPLYFPPKWSYYDDLFYQGQFPTMFYRTSSPELTFS